MTYRLGVDTGGTFTDFVATDQATGRLISLKVPTTPDAPARGVLTGLRQLGVELGFLAHGTTIVTNAIIEGRGAKTAFVTTRHFRDVFEITRQQRTDLYDLRKAQKPPPLVPRHLCFEVTERIAPDGEVLQLLEESELGPLATQLMALDVEAVAVCLLNSYATPDHEARVAEVLAENIRYVTASHEINAEYREYERASTTALNAMVKPLADRYLDGLESALTEEAGEVPLRILQSNGGMMSAKAARQRPLAMAVSGPAGGVAASVHLARRLELRNAIAFDMGGTTTDVCLISDGAAQYLSQRELGGYPVRLPSVGVESVGSGGGSIAWLDESGGLRVGPQSAGADPGPACYAKGGEQPTVTDAHIAAGTLRSTARFGEAIDIDRDRAVAALAPVAKRLELSLEETAAGVLEVANATMLRAIRLISVQRGFDLRGFTLIAYGGAGPLHAARLAHELRIPRVVVPAHAGVFSAFGCVATETANDIVQTFRSAVASLSDRELAARFEPLDEAVVAPLIADGIATDQIMLTRSLDLRYAGQNYELEVSWHGDCRRLRVDFNTTHERLFSFATDHPVECVNLRVRAHVPMEGIELPEWETREASSPVSEQAAYFQEIGEMPLPIYRREHLSPETSITGPALIEDPWATTLVYPGQSGRLDRHGNLHIEIGT